MQKADAGYPVASCLMHAPDRCERYMPQYVTLSASGGAKRNMVSPTAADAFGLCTALKTEGVKAYTINPAQVDTSMTRCAIVARMILIVSNAAGRHAMTVAAPLEHA